MPTFYNRQAGLSDNDYRDALEVVSGFRTSKSPALTDRDLDKALAYFEAIYWRSVDAGSLQPSSSATAVFRRRGYWAAKNTSQETSRDRFTGENLLARIAALERKLAGMGYGFTYCAEIRRKVTHGRNDGRSQHLYLAALTRTVEAKVKRQDREPVPN